MGTTKPGEEVSDESELCGVTVINANGDRDVAKKLLKDHEDAEELDKQPHEQDDGLPIDRGWAWVVLAGSFLNVILMVGYSQAKGLFFVEYVNEFQASALKTTLFMGVMAASFSLGSLITMNVILQLLGERKTVLLGGTIYSLGMLAAVFPTSMTYLICTHSILVGLGNSMMSGPALVLIGKYFKKRRGIATAVALSGNSLGNSIFPPMVNFLLDEYGVRGSMLILTGLTMNTLVGGALFRPLSSFGKVTEGLTTTRNDRKKKDQENTGEECEDNEDTVTVRDDSLTFRPISEEKAKNNQNVHKSIRANSPSSNELQQDSAWNNKESKQRKGAGMCIKHAFSGFDFSLFKQPKFLMFVTVAYFGIVLKLVLAYLPAFVVEKGFPQAEAAFLLTVSGVLDFFSRLAAGFIADLKYLKVNHLMAIGLLISGTTTMFTSYYNAYILLVVYSVIVGLFGGVFHCLMPVAIIDFMGLDNMPRVFGFVSVFYGLAVSVTHPIIGAIRDLTGSYNMSYIYIGICTYITAVVLLCEPLFRGRGTVTTSKSDENEREENKPLK
ncbi:monocarboxylate transporter 12-like [Haliotis asinina]|uniref:monocarboxylate transporter 12-like n=1 Tax=Haliotis asinina TaxID=109174 RepID=UPI003531836B